MEWREREIFQDINSFKEDQSGVRGSTDSESTRNGNWYDMSCKGKI